MKVETNGKVVNRLEDAMGQKKNNKHDETKRSKKKVRKRQQSELCP